ncbi:uncharacterized protein LOC141685335 [Apium graveolens]|uniref:uncharacterized protein LOC141685335 n=1 Tax=Apium graveolens TaxID=4045 RepID=UPI003D7B6059
MASISKSYLCKQYTIFKLDQKMRIEANVPPVTVEGTSVLYNEWVINIGDGLNGKETIVDAIYSDLEARYMEAGYFRDRAILTPINEDVDSINIEVLKRSSGKYKTYRSFDSICKSSVYYESQESMYPTDLNSLKFSGIPKHEL